MSEAILERLAAASALRATDIELQATAAGTSSWSQWFSARCRELLSEPFVHFLLLGAALFGINQHLEAKARFTHIAITPQIVRGIAENYRLQYGALPTPERLDALVDARIREEVFYHEALRLGLDKDDEIIRRRLVQKYEFLQQDVVADPNDSELHAFFAAHKQRYEIPPTISFSHVYFSTDTRGAEAYDHALRTAATLAASNVDRAVEAGDAFPGPTDFAHASQAELARVFGQQGLTSEIFRLEPHRWSRPIASGLGWHLIYINDRAPAHVPTFEDVREVLRRDYVEAAQAQRNAAAYEKLKLGFVIERQ